MARLSATAPLPRQGRKVAAHNVLFDPMAGVVFFAGGDKDRLESAMLCPLGRCGILKKPVKFF